MEPQAFAWVHATLDAAVFEGRERFGEPMARHEKEDFYTQWLDVGRLIGVRARDLPQDLLGFEVYFERVVAEELGWTPAIPEVLDTLNSPQPPRGCPIFCV